MRIQISGLILDARRGGRLLLGASAFAACLVVISASAQTIKGAVLAKNEPHHHLAYEDAELRVLRVSVPAKDTTLLHEHGPDYFWVALGASEVVNARLGQPDAAIKSMDLSIHYTMGKFAHVARNPGSAQFNNITVELLALHSNVKNRCEEAVAKATMDCPTSKKATPRPAAYPAFDTDQMQVELVTVAPGAILKGRAGGPKGSWLITLDTTVTKDLMHIVAPATKWVGGTMHAPAGVIWQVHSASTEPIKLISVRAK